MCAGPLEFSGALSWLGYPSTTHLDKIRYVKFKVIQGVTLTRVLGMNGGVEAYPRGRIIILTL